MKRIIFLLVFLASLAAGIFAQETSGTKVIVFKTSGELSIFNTNDLKKIELSRFDKDSVEHQDYVSQVFFRNDTTYSVIPIAEIDSVAFGVRNIIEPKPGVRRLTDEEAAAITYFDGEYIRYNSLGLSLEAEEVIFYDKITDVLPYGLCVKVNKVSDYEKEENNQIAEIVFLDPSEVFERYLITGNTQSEKKKAAGGNGSNRGCRIDFPYKDNNIESNIVLLFDTDLRTGENSYIDLVKGNAHVSFYLDFEPSLELKVKLLTAGKDTYNIAHFESERNFGLPPFLFLGGAVRANLDFKSFLEIMGEINVNMDCGMSYSVSFDWDLKKWKSEFGDLEVKNNNETPFEFKAEAQVKGELFLGGMCDLSLNLPMKSLGAGVELMIGPDFEGDFGLGALSKLSEGYDHEVYSRAIIEYSLLKMKLKSYYYFMKIIKEGGFLNISLQRDKRYLPFESNLSLFHGTINLFPDFNSRAVLAKSNSEFVKPADAPEVVSISSYTETELPIPLDIDFEIADKDKDETIAEVDIEETLKTADEVEETYQNIQGEIPMPEGISDERLENIVARPVINYMGYKVKAAPVNVASDMVFSPVIAVADKGGAYFVSGMTPVSQHRYDDDTYIEGNLVGVLPVDDRFKGKRTFTTIDFVDLSDLTDENGSVNPNHPLIGEWHGVIDDEDVTIHFLDDKAGTFNGKDFTYKFNSPLQGGISIVVEDGSTVTFSILNIDDREMTIVPKGMKQRAIILTKS